MARDTIPPESGVWPDRRAHRRVRLEAPVLIDARHSYGTARCHDVSEGGIAVQLERPLAAGTRVDVYFELPSGVAIELEAEVVRVEGTYLGLRFLALSEPEREALESYVFDPTERPRQAAR